MPHIRAALVLVAWAALILLGTPGLDFMGADVLKSTRDEDSLRARLGEPFASVAIGVATFNRQVRLPLERWITPIQRPFRVAQEWALYRDGPARVRRLEVWVDSTRVHRSADPTYPWLAGPLRNRRLRPVVESTCMSTGSVNWRGLARFIVTRAREDYPDAARVELLCTDAPFPGTGASVHHRYTATAPAWEAAPG